jgi:release factor glutamine methyltransferase
MAQTIQSVYKSTSLKLKELYSEEGARAMTDQLFRHYFNLTPVQRALSGREIAGVDKIICVEESVNKLLNHVPLQYVLGIAYFMDLEFEVNPSVLIPRPETEELVSLVCKDFTTKNNVSPLQILDIGTGSGCIAVSLKHYLPTSVVTAMDISADALQTAKSNALKNETSVTFILVDILDESQWDNFGHFDLIVSNPPYVTHAEKKLVQPNVLNYEPHTALFVADDDPLVFYRRIIEFANTKLSPDGSLWFEINEMFGNELHNMAMNQGFKEVNIIFDIRGKSRFLQCFK